MLTPYQFASNMPTIAVDIDGEEAKIKIHYHSFYNPGTVFHVVKTTQLWLVDDKKSQDDILLRSLLSPQGHWEVHKYSTITSKGIQYKDFGNAVFVPDGVNFQTGRIDLSNESMVFGMKVSFEFRTKASQVAKKLGMDVNHLMTIMAFETGGSFSPSQKNAAGSSAVGLIQFMKFTAKNLGTTTEALSKMTAVEQLEYVEKYMRTYKGKLNTLEDAYMAVLYPAAVGKDLNYVLFNQYKTVDDEQVETLEYKQNAGLDTDRDGKITKNEVSAVIRKKFEEGKKSKNK